MSAVESLRRRRKGSGRMGGGGSVVLGKAWQQKDQVFQGHPRPHVMRRGARSKLGKEYFNQQARDPLS